MVVVVMAIGSAGLCDAHLVCMQAPLEFTFRGMDPSPAIEAAAATWVARLDHVCDRIQRCHIWIDQPHRHRRRGASFQVKIDLAIPGAEIVVTQDGDEDVYIVLSDAFVAMRRQLQDNIQIRRDDTKHHVA
jgi:ribosome-associated translation inhibitor RaiA